ncbi:MAG TPA: hypothetical protein VFZ89_04755, partial [Solirubrobacteraceae bacterium]
LPAGSARTLRLAAGKPRGGVVSARVEGTLARARREIRLHKATRAQAAAACHPTGARVLARSARLEIVDGDSGMRLCERRTGRLDEITDSTADTAAAIYRGYIATVEDVCPGGFEDCAVGEILVQRYPSRRTVVAIDMSDSVGSIAVGRHGAVAWTYCPSVGESVACAPNARGREVWRMDARGPKRLARSVRVDGFSLRGARDGRSFSWREDGRRRTAHWRGAPRQ